MTFQDLTDWYLNLEKVKMLSSHWRKEIAHRKFNAMFGNIVVNQIKPVDLESYQARAKMKGFADKTIDEEIDEARTMIKKAFDNGMVGGDTLRTFNNVDRLLKKRGANARDKILSLDQFKTLMGHLPRHAKAIVATGFYTGMRRGEILNLVWDKVDLHNRTIELEASDTKDNEPRKIPIMKGLYDILSAIPRPLHDNHVFLYRGKPLKTLGKSLKNACEKAGILYGRFVKGGFVYHDLRHSFNTHMRKAGVAESVIMEITGHSTREMFDRYNTVDDDDTRKAVDQLQGFFESVDQNVDQTENLPPIKKPDVV